MRRSLRWWTYVGVGLGLALLFIARRAAPQPQHGRSPAAPTAQAGSTSRAPQAGSGTASTPRPKVAVDAGHGGTDLGGKHRDAQGNVDLTEAQVNLEVARLLRDLLQARGCDVILTRDGDGLGEPLQDFNGDGELTIRDDLQLRIDRVNARRADLLISLHENASDDDDPSLACSARGATTYYCADRPFAERSQRLATLLHERVLATIRRFGYEPDDLGVIDDHQLETPTGKGEHLYLLGPHDSVIRRPSLMPGVVSEPLFMTCDSEAALLTRADFRAALARAYADAIAAHLGLAPPAP